MEIFKLAGSIAINGAEEAAAKLRDIEEKAQHMATRVADKLRLNPNINTSNATRSLNSLTTTIAAQQRTLQALKNDYTAVVLAEGKNSAAAKALEREIRNLSSELKENQNKLRNASQAADQLDNSLEAVDNQARSTANGGFTVLKGAIANLVSQGFTRLIQSAGELIKGAASYQSSLEQYNTSFEVMTGSAEKAAAVTKKLGEIAANTPFEMTDVADTTQLLMNYGLTADDAIAKMQMLGDISQGSAEKMNRISMAYGQMSSAGKVSLEDVKQMIEAGFNPLQEISQTTGESMASLYNRISKGTITVDEITASMERSTAAGGKYYGSMDKQSQTLQGRLSTLKDTINSSLGKAMIPILETLANKVLPQVTAALEKVDWESFGEKAGKVFNKILSFAMWVIDNFDTISTLVIAVGAAFLTWKVVGIINGLITAIKALTATQWALNAAMSANPIGLIIAAIAALIAIIIVLVKNWDKVKAAGTKCWDGIKNAWNGAANWFKTKVSAPISKTFSNLWDGIKNSASKAWDTVTNGIKNLVNKIKNLFNFKIKYPEIKVPKFGIIPSGWKVGDLLKGKIPKLTVKWNAEGAIFNKPAIFNTQYGLQGVGEAGAEAVAPIDKLKNYVGESVHAETSGIADTIDKLIEMLAYYFPQITTNMDKNIVLDDGVLVGRLAPKMNKKFADIQKANERGR